MSQYLRAYKYRIYPTKEQQVKLAQTFGCVRFVWNRLVENFNAYGTDSYQSKLNEKTIKEDPASPWLKDVSAASLQQKRMDYQSTLSQFFNKLEDIRKHLGL